ncbi:MAG: cbb3-type cytochrome c oxidase subunit 3 [Rheinheimera sp.]|nr:cbb3-type cytochrome c oxidase subunit 3 [Rheinheimera sp.]
MEYATLHSIFTVILFVAFVVLVIWLFAKKRKSDFDKAANIVFEDEQKTQQKTKQESDHE